MNKKRSRVLMGIGGVVLLLLLKVIIDSPYRSHIPPLPDLSDLPVALKNQLNDANRKAFFKPNSNNLGILGTVYNSSAYYENAIDCYELAVRKDRSKWIWSYYLGYLYKEMGESAKAIENFQTVIKENPKAYHALYYIGEGYYNLGLSDKSENAFMKIASLKEKDQSGSKVFRYDYFPLRIYASYQLARLYINSNRIDIAENTLKEIIKNESTFGSAYRLLGSVYRIKGDSIASSNYIHRANDLFYYTSPVDTLIDVLALRSRSELYILKQIDEAENSQYTDWALMLINQALKYLPDNKYVISKAIKMFLKTNSGSLALPYLDQDILNFGDNYEELKQVADLLYEKGYYAQSNKYYSRVIILQPENTEVQANLILGLLHEGKKEQAMELMDKYLKSSSENPKVIANAVYIELVMGENEQAKYYLKKLHTLSPSSPKTLMLTGRIAQQDGNLAEAQSMYESAFRADPEDLLCIQSLGDILTRRKMWKRSIDHFKKALEYFPNDPYLLERTGTLLVTCPDTKLRNYTEGKGYLERVIIHKACPSEIMISAGSSLAQAYAALGDKSKASLYLKFVIQLAVRNDAPKEFLDELSKKLEEYD